MKKVTKFILIIFVFISFFISCNPDDTNDTPQPTEDPRDKFTGSWTCNENSHLNGNSSFTVNITLNPNNSSQIYLANFYQTGTNQKIYGIVTNSSITIPDQAVGTFPSLKGSGTITNNNTKINCNYYVNDGSDIDTCTAVFSK